MGMFKTRPVSTGTDRLTDGGPGRNTWYGETYVYPIIEPRMALAEEGSYFVATNATAATAIAGHVAPSLANNDPLPTKTLLHLFNGGSRTIYPDYLKLNFKVVNATSSATNFIQYLDNVGASSRASGGTEITPVSVRSDNPFTTGVTIWFGPVVSNPTTAKKVGQWQVRAVIAVVGDNVVFNWGGGNFPLISSLAIDGTAKAVLSVPCAPIALMPGGNFHVCEANPSGATTAATYEFEFGYWER